jgi:hypothetical protein
MYLQAGNSKDYMGYLTGLLEDTIPCCATEHCKQSKHSPSGQITALDVPPAKVGNLARPTKITGWVSGLGVGTCSSRLRGMHRNGDGAELV